MRDASTLTRPRFADAGRRLRQPCARLRPRRRATRSVDQPHYTLARRRAGAARAHDAQRSASTASRSCSRATTAPTTAACSTRSTCWASVRAAWRWSTKTSATTNSTRCTREACARCGWTCSCAPQWPDRRDRGLRSRRSIARVKPLGWHVQFYTPGYVVRDLIPVPGRLRGRLRDRPHGLHAGKRRPDARRLRPPDRGRAARPRLDEAVRPLPRRQGRQLRAACGRCPRRSSTRVRRAHRLGQRLAAHPERANATPASC